MERKIGEIFEVDGQWYQCVQGNCEVCDFSRDEHTCLLGVSNCVKFRRNNDCKAVAFKKLEKVGEHYKNNDRTYQLYKLPMNLEKLLSHTEGITSVTSDIVEIEIKQKEEDMEEKGITLDDAIKYCSDAGKHSASIDCKIINYKIRDWLTELKQYKDKERFNSKSTEKDLKPFSLEAAKAGKPVCTRDGRKARIICFDRNSNKPIVALITTNDREYLTEYYCDGRISHNSSESNDLMMLPEKKEGWIIVSKNASIYDSLDDAKKSFDSDKELCICKVEWEE